MDDSSKGVDHATVAACGNRWKYGKDVCAKEAGHIGPHRTTRELEAHSFGWFDNDGTPPDKADSSAQPEPLEVAASALYSATLRAERAAKHARRLAESLESAAKEARAAYENASAPAGGE